MSRRWITPVAWAGVVLAVSSPVPGHSAPERPDLVAAAARLDVLHVRISGNRAELQASELLNYHRVEGGVARCMRAAGKAYRPRPFLSRYDGFTDADLGYGSGGGSVLDSITDRGRRLIRNEIAAARSRQAGLTDWEGARPADSAALNRCTAPFQHRTYPDVQPPAGVYRFAGFAELSRAANRDPAVIAALRPYRGCMKQRYGVEVTERTDFLFAPRLPAEGAPLDGRPPGAAWKAGVKEVRAAFDADVDCRLPAYRAAMTVVAPRIAAWERKHRKEITAIRTAWRLRVAQARGLPRKINF